LHFPNNTISRIRLSVATLKDDLQGIFTVLGVNDVPGALSAIADFKANAQTSSAWQTNQKAFFEILGVDDQAAAVSVLAAWKADRDAIYSALGATDRDTALAAITANAQAGTRATTAESNLTAFYSAVGVNDHTAAMARIAELNTLPSRITELEASQKDFDARLENGIREGLIKRAASAGLPAPVEKPKGEQSPASQLTGMDRVQAAIAEQLNQPTK
jgi:hypothetical protein